MSRDEDISSLPPSHSPLPVELEEGELSSRPLPKGDSFGAHMKRTAIEEMDLKEVNSEDLLPTPMDVMRERYGREEEERQAYAQRTEEEQSFLREVHRFIQGMHRGNEQIALLKELEENALQSPTLSSMAKNEVRSKVDEFLAQLDTGKFQKKFLELQSVQEKEDETGIFQSFVKGFVHANEQVQEFRHYVTHQMDAKKMSPAEMVRLQVVMNEVTHEVDFFSKSLGKAIESIKQLFSTQA